ncbi:MAG TPA: MFS transporter, partial [Bacteroidia bacterium]
MSQFTKPSLEIFKIKNFLYFITGRFFTTLAIQMQMTIIGLQVYYEYTHSAFSLGLTGLFEALPFIGASF